MRCCMTIPSPGPHSAASTHLVRGLLRLGVAEQIRHPQLECGQHFLDSAPGVAFDHHSTLPLTGSERGAAVLMGGALEVAASVSFDLVRAALSQGVDEADSTDGPRQAAHPRCDPPGWRVSA